MHGMVKKNGTAARLGLKQNNCGPRASPSIAKSRIENNLLGQKQPSMSKIFLQASYLQDSYGATVVPNLELRQFARQETN